MESPIESQELVLDREDILAKLGNLGLAIDALDGDKPINPAIKVEIIALEDQALRAGASENEVDGITATLRQAVGLSSRAAS